MSSSSSSSSGSIGSLQTSNLLRLTGTNLMSGLDTDNIIKALTAGTQSKIDKQKQLEQIAEWKRDMYRDVTTSLKTFSNTYFSFTNSSTNILSASFFNSTSITSSSSAVSATGNANNAKNMIINSISQLASAATYNSSQKASTEAITSGTIYDSWNKSRVGGQSVVVSYGGKDYTLSLSNSVILDSHNLQKDSDGNPIADTINDTEIQKIAAGLNDQINADDNLKGKIAFSYDASSGKFKLTATDPTKSVGIKPFRTDANDTVGPEFFTELGFSNPITGSGSISSATGVNKSITQNAATSLFDHSIAPTSQFSFSYGSENFSLNLGAKIDITGVSDQHSILNSITDQLNKQINSTSDTSPYKDIKGKLNFSVTGTGSSARITVNNTGDQDFTITGGSENFQKGFGMLATVGHGTSGSFADADTSKLTTTYFGDALQGSTLTFNLDGLKKTITFGTDESQYDDLNGAVGSNGVNISGLQKLQSYLQQQIDSNFGTNSDGTKKITVGVNSTSGQLSFKVADSASILSLTSSDGLNVLNQNGALRILSGETNRLETGKTLQDLATDSGGSGEFTQKLQAGSDGTYKITVNGQTFSFSGTDTVGDVMTKINDNTAAGVTISYSQTTDTFRIISSETGSQGKLNISDTSGNLANVLFGLSTVNTGAITSNGGSVTSASDSSYLITYGTNSAQTITLPAGSYSSVNTLASAVQTAINSNSTLNGKITVTTDSGHLKFQSSDGSTPLVVESAGTGNVLGLSKTAVTTGAVSTDGNGAIANSSGSDYQITLGANSAQLISLTAGSYSSISDLASAVQTAINNNDTLRNKITVTAQSGYLAFQSADGTSPISISSTGTGNVLNVDKTAAGTGTIATGSNGSITNASDSSYLINLGSNSTQTITLAAGANYSSITDFASAVQSAINNNDTLKDKITVTAQSGRLVFKAADGSSALSVQSAGTGNILNTNNTETAGKDLIMSVNLNGSNTPTTITRASNSFTLDGVTITANRQTSSTETPITFSSTSSTDDLYKKISDFVTAYNAILAKVNTYTTDTPERDSDHKLKYQPLSDDAKKDMTSDEINKWNTEAKKGLLQNDNTLNGIISDLNTTMNLAETSSGLSLSQIGITTKAYDYTSGGQLGIDETTLKSKLATDPDRVQELFTNATDGIATKLSNMLDKYVGTFGGKGALISLAGTDTTINDQSQMSTEINQYGKNISDLKDQLQTQQDHWWSKFTSMEQSLSKLNSQMGYLNSMNGSSSS